MMIVEHLCNEIDTVAKLYDILLQEHEVLISGQLTDLEQLLEQKRDYLDQLDTLIKQRTQKFSPPADVKHTVDNKDNNSFNQTEALRLWHLLQDKSQQAKTQNLINARLVAASKAHTEQALIILSGTDNQSNVYDRDAQLNSRSENNRKVVAIA